MAEQRYSWEDLKSGLRSLHERHPDFLKKAILVGGAACMFYRSVLARSQSPHFQVPDAGPEGEAVWLSKDVYFNHIAREDLPASPPVPLGLLQSGLRLSALDFAETVRTSALEFEDGSIVPILVADPLELYREKQACVAKLQRPQDRAHLELLKVYLAYELDLARKSNDPGERIALEARYQNYAPDLLV
ncbi:MAG: hypothetical protein SFU85_07625 [Candidatus Methylacidiphilales bacterium]|nr:hypothetical protein [Candidatus Methylacidiphilales bacterium]